MSEGCTWQTWTWYKRCFATNSNNNKAATTTTIPVWLELGLIPLCIDTQMAKQLSSLAVSQDYRPTLGLKKIERCQELEQKKSIFCEWGECSVLPLICRSKMRLTSNWVLEIHSKFLAHRQAGNSRRGLHVNLKLRQSKLLKLCVLVSI